MRWWFTRVEAGQKSKYDRPASSHDSTFTAASRVPIILIEDFLFWRALNGGVRYRDYKLVTRGCVVRERSW